MLAPVRGRRQVSPGSRSTCGLGSLMPPEKVLLLHCRTALAALPRASLGLQPLLAALSFPAHSPGRQLRGGSWASFLERRLRDGGLLEWAPFIQANSPWKAVVPTGTSA